MYVAVRVWRRTHQRQAYLRRLDGERLGERKASEREGGERQDRFLSTRLGTIHLEEGPLSLQLAYLSGARTVTQDTRLLPGGWRPPGGARRV